MRKRSRGLEDDDDVCASVSFSHMRKNETDGGKGGGKVGSVWWEDERLLAVSFLLASDPLPALAWEKKG